MSFIQVLGDQRGSADVFREKLERNHAQNQEWLRAYVRAYVRACAVTLVACRGGFGVEACDFNPCVLTSDVQVNPMFRGL